MRAPRDPSREGKDGKFARRLSRLVSRLRRKDRFCGDCAEFVRGDCCLHEGPIAGPLDTRSEAIGCDQWRERT